MNTSKLNKNEVSKLKYLADFVKSTELFGKQKTQLV